MRYFFIKIHKCFMYTYKNNYYIAVRFSMICAVLNY